MSYNLNVLYLKPAIGPATPEGGSNGPLAGQALTVTSTATVQFAAFNAITDAVTLDIQGGNTYCTFDGTTPAAGAAHILYNGQAYTWSRATAAAAKFVATTTGNATIFASQFQA